MMTEALSAIAYHKWSVHTESRIISEVTGAKLNELKYKVDKIIDVDEDIVCIYEMAVAQI